ncbi:MAG: ABC transporter permease [candidate division NC10 bacterium]|nr:ABC transporter permease [candidate division NC10 bacterium]MBI2456354.1 ABC transporter permease [candidate division NC10 bacterium]
MLAFVARRLLFAPLSLFLVSFATFVILRVTGDPVDIYLDINRTPEQVEMLRHRLHLDQSLPVQFAIFLGDVVRGDFGTSLQFAGPALPVVLERLGKTVQLLCVALSLAVVVGILAGIASAVWKDRAADFVLSSLAVAGQSIPSFWLGILLIELFALRLGWLPTSGTGSWRHLILPAVTLSMFLLPNFVLLTRTSVLEFISEQFVVTAKSKGLSQRQVLCKHVLPNAINPVVSFLGLQIGRLMGGSIITESIFAWPGVGRLVIGSIFQRDVPVVAAAVFIVSLAIIVSNLLVDIANSLIDPRIRLE